MRIRPLLPIAALACLPIITVGCGSGESATPIAAVTTTKPASAAGPDLSKATFVDETGKAEVAVTVRDNVFVAPYTEVSAGTKVTFTNAGQQPHNVTPVDADEFTAIPTKDMQPKDSGTVTFDEPGDYSYYCTLHGTPSKGMIGTVRVLK